MADDVEVAGNGDIGSEVCSAGGGEGGKRREADNIEGGAEGSCTGDGGGTADFKGGIGGSPCIDAESGVAGQFEVGRDGDSAVKGGKGIEDGGSREGPGTTDGLGDASACRAVGIVEGDTDGIGIGGGDGEGGGVKGEGDYLGILELASFCYFDAGDATGSGCGGTNERAGGTTPLEEAACGTIGKS